MKTSTRGNAVEAQILAAFVDRGFDVLTPFGGGQPFDLVVHLGDSRFLRVQCNTAWLIDADASRSIAARPTMGAAVSPISAHIGRLRLEPTKNNQQRGVRFAADFEIDRWSREKLRSLTT